MVQFLIISKILEYLFSRFFNLSVFELLIKNFDSTFTSHLYFYYILPSLLLAFCFLFPIYNFLPASLVISS